MASHLIFNPVATTSTSYAKLRPESVVTVDVEGDNVTTFSWINLTCFGMRALRGRRKSSLARSPEPTKVLAASQVMKKAHEILAYHPGYEYRSEKGGRRDLALTHLVIMMACPINKCDVPFTQCSPTCLQAIIYLICHRNPTATFGS